MVWGFESPPAHQPPDRDGPSDFFHEGPHPSRPCSSSVVRSCYRLHALRDAPMTHSRSTFIALAAAFIAAPMHAQEAAASVDFYFNLYPEWKVQHFDAPSKTGTDVGTMGTLRNDTTVLSKNANAKAQFDGQAWSNSYVGARGRNTAGALTLGFDLQGLIDLQGSVERNLHT